MFAAAVAFQIVTLPVEFDATRRAKEVMNSYGILEPAEAAGAAKVLDAAAWTYIAAAVASILQLLYFLIVKYGFAIFHFHQRHSVLTPDLPKGVTFGKQRSQPIAVTR